MPEAAEPIITVTKATAKDIARVNADMSWWKDRMPPGFRMHGFTDDILPEHGPQSRPAIAPARKRRLARAFQLNVPQFTGGVAYLCQKQSTAVAQLPGPDAKLVAGINHRQRFATGIGPVAGENFRKNRG